MTVYGPLTSDCVHVDVYAPACALDGMLNVQVGVKV